MRSKCARRLARGGEESERGPGAIRSTNDAFKSGAGICGGRGIGGDRIELDGMNAGARDALICDLLDFGP
ncbi:hypothetical protein SBA5_290168 [Candidatus Sulfotelmatomonas gaucii]|uniref:Uncharacterized protein n=1 Tax=Candidatus Sulfuritelmatomonas gaucii TaxID=2043161 RepID=A0A2N9LB99_9BACT|nr:hypothetical protein SBA5_290168 [Candidatus Sulfotelmatomonas gaucii]